jgi:phosphoribosyl 1,2-cyclic phosphodiesterase
VSYTPEVQHLCPSITKVLEGMDDLDAAIMARHRNRDLWQEDHLQEILELSIDLRRMQVRLRKLEAEVI